MHGISLALTRIKQIRFSNSYSLITRLTFDIVSRVPVNADTQRGAGE